MIRNLIHKADFGRVNIYGIDFLGSEFNIIARDIAPQHLLNLTNLMLYIQTRYFPQHVKYRLKTIINEETTENEDRQESSLR